MSTATVTENTAKSLESYDLVPYESFPFPQTHPNRLATMAKLFGMTPADIETCRVLELGSAAGGNIIPIAFNFPKSKVVGVDFSLKQIEDGQKFIKKMGLKNIELRHADIATLTKEELGTFDYIICHGVFAWVPPHVQERILQICEDCLSPNGVAYISYNTYPGWHYRGMIRDMMMYHTSTFTDHNQKAQQARAVLDFLHKSVPTEHNAYGIMLKNEVELLRLQKDSYLLHEYVEDANTPFYFHQFMALAANHKLQYLAEADFSTMLTSNFGQSVAETLKQVSNDIIKTEQYMDFVRNRTFRQTLLCRSDVQLNRNLSQQTVKSFYISSSAKPENAKFDLSMTHEKFALPDGKSITSGNPIVRAAFHHLAEIFPQNIPFAELITKARGMISSSRIQDGQTIEIEENLLANDLLNCYTVDIVQLHSHKMPFVQALSEKPEVSKLARTQATSQNAITNQLHGTIPIDVFAARLLVLCDGTKTRDEILTGLVELAKKEDLVVQKEGKIVKDDATLRELLSTVMDERLALFPNAAILVG